MFFVKLIYLVSRIFLPGLFFFFVYIFSAICLHFFAAINNKLPIKNKKPRRKRRSPRKIKNFEAEDYDEEYEKLRNTGIRTKDHTRDLCRRMIQTTDLNHKVILADLLRYYLFTFCLFTFVCLLF